MPIEERRDVLHLVESQVEEALFFEGMTPNDAVSFVGDPKKLARQHLGAAIRKTENMNLTKLRMTVAFYRASGDSLMIIVPALSVLALILAVTGVVIVIMALIQTRRFMAGGTIHSSLMQFGVFEAYPVSAFSLILLLGGLLIAGGIGVAYFMWRYMKKATQKRNEEFFFF